MSEGEPQYIGVDSPKQIYGAWIADFTTVLYLTNAVLSQNSHYPGFQAHPHLFAPIFIAFGFISAIIINGAILRGLSGGSVGDHIFRIARVNPHTWAPLGILHAARYSLAPVYEIFFHMRAEQSKFRKPATIVARHYVGQRPVNESKQTK